MNLRTGNGLREDVPIILCVLKTAGQEPAPLNWKARCFDFGVQAWIDGLLPNTACEFTPMHGPAKYYLRRRTGKLFRMPKREAVYAAAMLKGVRLVDYEPDAMKLSTPLFRTLCRRYTLGPHVFVRVVLRRQSTADLSTAM